jgi:hypothetical protein
MRPADLPTAAPELAGVRWERVTGDAQLALWEQAWTGEPATTELPRVFLPPLLADPDVAFIAAVTPAGVCAGAIANRAAGVVGFSNFFAPAADKQAFLAGCLAFALAALPGLPLIGYEQDEDLPPMRALGFQAIGSLRVWASPPTPATTSASAAASAPRAPAAR